ncbi:MAG: 30S ribosomal protein S24e [Thermoplasmatales archaeon]|nr:30S ribosomal protein S24e [Candidatus Thermoplasmatota archaeon]MDA8054517.1 30S ribosomal protein S24e [Thermoplasmatales archaeon]
MKIEIKSREENKLLKRVEVHYRAVHQKEKTPSRDEARNQIAANLQVPKDLVIIDYQKSKFGKSYTEGYAKVYQTKEDAMALEPDFLLIRNGLKSKEGDQNAKAGNV